ncbi:potassium transporter-domain-containing protein [Pseudomassariella vexata]|uniref:Potassium transporter-domain-containing protein n=1 Tax=Pseudomassariella vexata TaxID=1141098 RepID=A0A1Y2EES1_9PEZI|nr:potassium transporter-domain-containing protein [Pseudomassariella vexata]ORY70059.1 potassium transporter-domain-containing protein [Pseudomassariella vexata]
MAEDDAIESVRRTSSGTGALRLTSPKSSINTGQKQSSALSEKTHDIDDEERARRIAEVDLDQHHKQAYRGPLLLWLSFQSIGVIYGDIGTSPLYVYSSTFTSQPSWDDLVGALSIIIWSLTLIVTVKYCFIVLAADDDGQGGTFALYSLLSRYTNIAKQDPHGQGGMRKMDRYETNDLKPINRGLRSFLENSSTAQFALKVIGVIGVSLVLADGVLTPAQSVLGAIQGIRVANPALGTPAVVGISCAILVFLFCIQPFGTSKLGTAFAPIVTIWLLFNLSSGIYNLALYDHTVLKAFSPYFAFAYLTRNGFEGWKSLGGLLLAFTGVEALFADLGAFSRKAVQMSWLCLAFPCLILAYAGQAAYISMDATETAYSNPFFYTVPPGTLYFSLVLAVLAAIVASQAMITSSFQLLSQVMRLSYFPHVKTVHTSSRFHDQIYIPMANWLLMIGTIIVTAVYNNTTSLGNAYGVCVILVTFITTCMLALVAILIWRTPFYLILPVFLIFVSLDGAFTSSVLVKVPDGAWFTILLAAILSSIFVLWRYGKESQWAAESLGRLAPSSLIRSTESTPYLTVGYGGSRISTVDGLGIFFDKTGDWNVLPVSFTQFLIKFAARPRILLFFHMRPLPVPSVPMDERYVIRQIDGVGPGCYAVVLRHGYADDVIRPGLARELVAQVELLISSRRGTEAPELEALRVACDAQTVYVLGKETMRIKNADGIGAFFRRVLLGTFLWLRENTRTKLADLDIDADKLIEVGFVKEI